MATPDDANMIINYNDYLTYIDAMEEPLPVSERTVRIYLDILVATIARTDLVQWESRTTVAFFKVST